MITRALCVVSVAVACSSSPSPSPRPASTAQPSVEANRAQFSRAEAYDRYMGRWSQLLAPQLVRFADVRDGARVLDVGCGTGMLARAVLAATTSSEVVGIDPSQAYVARAREQVADPRARFEVGDAQQLALPAASFDRTLALLVMNFIPDPARALAEMKRVTRPDGVIAAAVWDYGGGMEMVRVFWDEAIALDPGNAGGDQTHSPLSRAGELAALWRAAGLTEVEEQPLSITMKFSSFDDYWSPFLLGQGGAGSYVAKLTPERRAALEQRLRRRLLGDGPDRPFEMTARVWAVRGRVSAAASPAP